MWRSSLWSISWLCHQMFFPYVTISDDLRHTMSPFSLFFSSFSGMQRILGYVRPRRIVAVHPPETGRRRSLWRSLQTGTDFTRCCDIIGLQTLLWRMQTWTETQQQTEFTPLKQTGHCRANCLIPLPTCSVYWCKNTEISHWLLMFGTVPLKYQYDLSMKHTSL